MTSLANVVHQALQQSHSSPSGKLDGHNEPQQNHSTAVEDHNTVKSNIAARAAEKSHPENIGDSHEPMNNSDAEASNGTTGVKGATWRPEEHEANRDDRAQGAAQGTAKVNGEKLSVDEQAQEGAQDGYFNPSHRGKHVLFKPFPANSPRLPPIDTPSGRTGPPRSLSYGYPTSPRPRQSFQSHMESDISSYEDSDAILRPNLSRRTPTEYRGALEYSSPGQRDREREAAEKKERHRQNRLLLDETWNPLKWLGGIAEVPVSSPREDGFVESPLVERHTGKEREDTSEKREHDGQDREVEQSANVDHETEQSQPKSPDPQSVAKRWRGSRTQSLRGPSQSDDSRPPTTPRWNRLRSLLPIIAHQGKEQSLPGQTAVQGQTVNITDELITGGLSTLMLRLWFERDEHDHRRVPVLLHRLRLRISDSLHPLSGHKAVFRIECEYANGAVRWVIYRQLRDFLSLHTHYRLSNAYNRNIEALPEFPRTSMSSGLLFDSR